MPPQWDPTRLYGHPSHRMALIIGMVCCAVVLIFSLGIIVWIIYGIATFFLDTEISNESL